MSSMVASGRSLSTDVAAATIRSTLRRASARRRFGVPAPTVAVMLRWYARDDNLDKLTKIVNSDSMSENRVTEHGRTVDRFVAVADGDLHVVEDGRADAPALLLIHGSAGSTAWWDPMI